jgi:two-component system, NarL family, sensor histidine kinase DesK
VKLWSHDQELGWTPLVWLVWLSAFFVQPVTQGASTLEWTAYLVCLAVFLPLYFLGYAWSGRRVLRVSLAILLLGVVFSPFNAGATTFFIYAAAFLGPAIPGRRAYAWVLGYTALLGLEALIVGIGASGLVAGLLFTPLIGSINVHYAGVSRRNARLRLAQEEVERLAKLDERERIARDMHDLLGHSLAVITLKSQLAERVVGSDPERAASELREIERISRETTNEVRRAVRGYRAQKLGTELAKARLALETAGVGLTVEAGPFVLGSEQESAVALALREAVTNVVRHARAQSCTVRIDAGRQGFVLEVEDDGRGVRRAEGSGLTGMRERIATLGGTVEVETSTRGTLVRVVLPLRRSDVEPASLVEPDAVAMTAEGHT